MDLTARLDHHVVAVQQDNDLHVMLELTAPPAPTDAQRQPLRIAVVIDRSGSMGGGRLDTARRCTSWLAHRLDARDQLAVVAYDDAARTVVPLDGVEPDRVDAALARVQTGGSTNLSAGWMTGAEELERAQDGRRRVVLLSDGHANQGVTDHGQLRGIAEQLRGRGVSTSTIGVGSGFDEVLMSAVADAGGGAAHFVEHLDDAPAVFADEFDDLVDVVAQNLSVEVRPTDDVDVVGVLNRFPSLPVPGGVKVEIGDAFGGQTIRVVLRLRIPAVAALGLADVGEVVLRWVGLGDEVTQHVVRQRLTVNAVSADDAAMAHPDPDVVQEVTVLAAARAAEEAREAAERGDRRTASALLDEAVIDLAALEADHPAADELHRLRLDLDRTRASLAADQWAGADAKRAWHASRDLSARKRRSRTSRGRPEDGQD